MPEIRYQMTPCAMELFRQLWPKKGNSADPDWLKAQRRLQSALIRCHMDEMDTPTRERATRTLEWLDSLL